MIRDIKLAEKDYYQGIEGLKGVNTDKLLNQSMIKEYIKCAKDPLYFIENYLIITTPDGDEVPFKLYPYQKEMLNKIESNRLNIYLCCRQAGKSQFLCGYVIWNIIFNRNFKVKWLANKLDTAMEMIDRIKFSYMKLPLWLQKAVKEFNKSSLTLENGSKVSCASTTMNSGRGSSVSLLLLDEFAFVDRNIQDAFLASAFPTILSGKRTKLCLISTPNGQEKFYELFTSAQKGLNDFAWLFVDWKQVPGRDEKWKKMAIDVNGLAKFRIEHECKFEDSTATLICKELLDMAYHPINKDNITYQITQLNPDNPKDTYKVFHNYDPNMRYWIQVDPSSGSGLDYTVINVFGKKDRKWIQCAIWHCNSMNNNKTLDWLVHIANEYNNPIIGVECNGIGEALVERLYYEKEYENVLITKYDTYKKKWDLYYGGIIKGATLGIKTTNNIKLSGGDRLRDMFEEKRIILHDEETVKEFRTFIKSGSSYEAEKGHNDDIAMTHLLFAWVESNDNFEDIIEDIQSAESYIDTPPMPISMSNYSKYSSMEDFLNN